MAVKPTINDQIVDILVDTADIQPKMGTPSTDISADVKRFGTGTLISKQITLNTGAPPVTETLFTVTGEVEVVVIGYIDVAVTSGDALTLEVGVTGATTGLIALTAVANLTIDKLWIDVTPAVLVTKPSWKVIANGADIVHTIRDFAATAGQITYYCWWRPLSTDGNVVAA